MKKHRLISILVFAALVSSISPATAQLRREAEPESSATPMQLPRFYARHVEEGNKLLVENQIQGAIDEFFAAKTINPDYYPTYIGLGNAYRKMGQLDRAVENYQIAVRLLNPSYGSDHVLRGDYFAERRQFQQALNDYWDVLRIDPQAGRQYTLAMRHLRFQDDKKAVKAFEAAIVIDEDYADPHFQLGNLYFRDNKAKKAIDPYKSAVKLDPGNPLYHFALGTALYKEATRKAKSDMRMVDDAKLEFEQALRLGMQLPRLHFNLGTSYILTENYDQAISHLKEAINRGLTDEEAYYNLGNAFFRKGMTIDFKWDGYANLTDLSKRKKNDDKFRNILNAVKAYQISIHKKEDYAPVYYDLGVAFYRLSELKLSPEFIPAMLEDVSTQKDYATRGVKFFRIDMLTRAISDFKRFQSLTNNSKASANASKIVADLQGQLKDLQ